MSVLVPSQTRGGVAIDHAAWKTQTIEEMAKLFRGATAIEGDGGWRDDDQSGGIVVEKVSMVFSLMAKSDWNKKTAAQLAQFLRRMGRETNQGEIGLMVNAEYFPIREFDDEESTQT